jgi:tetratricopeptide (TPR) repeat protein
MRFRRYPMPELAQIQHFLVVFLIFNSLGAFYYEHDLISIPESLRRPYQERHHLSEAFDQLFSKALNAYRNLDFKRAEQAYNTLLLINSNDILALDKLIQVYIKQGKYELAMTSARSLLEKDPSYYPAHQLLARLHLYRKDFKASIGHAKVLIETGNAYLETYVTLVNALFFLGQYDNVLAICKVARATGSQHPQFEFFPLLIHFLQGRETAFQTEWGRFSEKYGTRIDGVLYEAILAAVQGSPDLEILKKRIEKTRFAHPAAPWIFMVLALEELGLVLERFDLLEEAVAMASKAHEEAPKFLLPYRVALDILIKGQQYLKVMKWTAQGLKAFPSYVPFHEFRGEAAFFLGEKSLALESLDYALGIRNKSAELLSFFAILLLKDGQIEKGFDATEKAIFMDKESGFAQSALGLYYQKTGEPVRAEISLKQALSGSLAYSLPYNLLIQIYREARKRGDALKVALHGITVLNDVALYDEAVKLAFELKDYRLCARLGMQAAKLFPEDSSYAFIAARSYQELKEYDRTLIALERIGFSSSGTVEHNLLYLEALIGLKLYPEALFKVQSLLKIQSAHPDYLGFLARYYGIQKEFNKSLVLYEKIQKLTRSKRHRLEIGWLQFLLHKQKAGINNLKLALAQGRKEVRALAAYRLGLIYSLRKGKEADSSGFYTRGMELAPRSSVAYGDHRLYNELSEKKYDPVISKNMRLYLE